MLHLALAENMLRALAGKQLLYDESFMPTYPSQILYDEINMELRPADKKNLDCFLKVTMVSMLGTTDRTSPVWMSAD